MKDVLQELVNKFNKSESKKKEKIKDIERTVVIKFEDDGTYHTHLKNSTLSDVEEGDVEGEIIITTTTETFRKILNGQEDALTAYLTKKIKVKAKLMDKLLLNDLLG